VDFQEDLCPIITKLTEGFSFAYLKGLFVWALLTVARGRSVEEEVISDKEAALNDSNISDTTPNNGLAVVESADVIKQASGEPQEPTITNMAVVEAALEKKIAVPEVKIPVHLQDNVLLKVIQAQIKMLVEEMDNTTKENSSTKKKDGLPRAQMSAQMALRTRRFAQISCQLAQSSIAGYPFLP
jgi:transitional endoplasmic reticulum ATPase